MAMILSRSRLRLTEAKFFGNSQTSGSVTSLTQGTGIALTPNPIVATGSIAIATPVANVNGGTGADTSGTGGAGLYVKQVTLGGAFTIGAPVATDLTGIVPYANGGTNASTAWTPGSVMFAGATTFAQDNANLFWDNTNKRLGVGIATPIGLVHTKGGSTTEHYIETSNVAASAGTRYVKPAQSWIVGVGTGTADQNFQIYDVTGTANRLSIAVTTGNVGISTTSPFNTLDTRGKVMIAGSAPSVAGKTPLTIINKPGSVATGESGAIRFNCGAEPDYGTPQAENLVGITGIVNNGSDTNVGMWGFDTIVYQAAGSNPVPGAGGIHIVGYECEVGNQATAGNVQLDPVGSIANKIRSNGLEIIGLTASTYRNAGAIVTYAADANAGWWDTGICLSRVQSTGIQFRYLAGFDAITPFQTALMDISSLTLAIQPFILGNSTINTNLFIKNNADHSVYLTLDAGKTVSEETFLFFSDKGARRWAMGKSTSNEFSLGFDDGAIARSGVRMDDNGAAIKLGFFGTAPILKPATPVLLADVIALLQALGLCS